jgi:hypothetical protein
MDVAIVCASGEKGEAMKIFSISAQLYCAARVAMVN